MSTISITIVSRSGRKPNPQLLKCLVALARERNNDWACLIAEEYTPEKGSCTPDKAKCVREPPTCTSAGRSIPASHHGRFRHRPGSGCPAH